MSFPEWLQLLTLFGVVVSGSFAFVKWVDQRRRELEERRFEQYWKLLEICLESPYLAKQKAAILLLKRFPEYRDETVACLSDERTKQHNWAKQNAVQIDDVLRYFGARVPSATSDKTSGASA